MHKSASDGGLGAINTGFKCMISFCKNVSTGILRNATWVGDPLKWKKHRGRARAALPYYKLAYSDFIGTHSKLKINWGTNSNKIIYNRISEALYGGLVNFKDCSQEQSKQLVKCLNSGLISGGTRDVIWLTVHGRLPVRKVVKWARTITITECPVPQCKETETIGHLLIDCVRSKEVWDKMSSIGVRVPCHRKTLYADFICDKENYDLFWTCVCVTVYKIWKTR